MIDLLRSESITSQWNKSFPPVLLVPCIKNQESYDFLLNLFAQCFLNDGENQKFASMIFLAFQAKYLVLNQATKKIFSAQVQQQLNLNLLSVMNSTYLTDIARINEVHTACVVILHYVTIE